MQDDNNKTSHSFNKKERKKKETYCIKKTSMTKK